MSCGALTISQRPLDPQHEDERDLRIYLIMVKFYDTSFTYDYPFSAVSLAYFLRYPNPFATHVLSTDVISRHFDPDKQQLSTTRLQLKKSKIPQPILKILPKGILGRGGQTGQSFVLETSLVDIKEGWMKTESRNMEWTGILSVIERQTIRRPPRAQIEEQAKGGDLVEAMKNEDTEVNATVTLVSRFGQARMRRRQEARNAANSTESEEEAPPKKGFFASWSTAGLQRTIETYGLQRTRQSFTKSTEGMKVVLDRLRGGGLVRVLEGMKQDGQPTLGQNGAWKETWRQGREEQDS
ncbi:uncharacterized protein KY384_006126 [Bacidia gigantensis]|uniref:uncharacterized protein n=1 Tax=Bacidia gigantensis TaxID=2732470 RepID=UPI001D052AA7|nr:uncharacterized protein KY384_006126 [Bacidia gigantensis]KAG8529489.1 hypothetical protein KY384_006126 [Bacidia gigantensis]